MADLLEQKTFGTLDQQFLHWYYFTKVSAINGLIAPLLSSGRRSFLCLDIGAGNGIISFGLSKLNQCHNLIWNRVDINYTANDLLSDPLKARTIPPGAVYDIIVACDVLEHLESPAMLVEKLLQHCHANTMLAITVPAHQYLWSYHDVALKHYKRYTIMDLISDLNPHFYILDISYMYRILLPALILYRKILIHFFPRLTNRSYSDMKPLPYLQNTILTWLLRFEFIAARICPCAAYIHGSTILALAKPSQSKELPVV